MVKCACSGPCETELRFDEPSQDSVFAEMTEGTLKGRWCTMYLDANGIVKLIRELQDILLQLGTNPR